jgi:L-cysteine S-thiosulfotransferase
MTKLRTIRNLIFALLFFPLCWTFTSCESEGAGFALPPGDLENGKMNFVGLACTQCHSVADIEWEGVDGQDVHFRLGGDVTRLKTYGELVTSIINPTHRIARNFRREFPGKVQSPMANYNSVMTVEELVDLVTFLEKEYKMIPPSSYYPNL